jgi:peptidoglycan/LPS O-acetylase OafA/YrhL
MWSINGVYWTLSHEWSFYLLMGLAAPLVRRFSGSWPMVVGLIAVTLLVRWGWITGRWTLPNGHLHPLCVWEQFAFGILAAALTHRWQKAGTIPRDSVLCGVLAAGLVAVCVGLLRYHSILDSIPEDKLGTPTAYLAVLKAFAKKKSIFLSSQLLISFGFGCVLLVAWLRGSALTKWLRFTPLPWMGMVSYSTYLWHLPVILCLVNLKRRATTTPGLSRWLDEPWSFVAVATIFTYVISWISYRGLEEPYFKKREARL